MAPEGVKCSKHFKFENMKKMVKNVVYEHVSMKTFPLVGDF